MDDESTIIRRRLLSTISLKENRISYLRHVALFLEINKFVKTLEVFREECYACGYDLSYIAPFEIENSSELRTEPKPEASKGVKADNESVGSSRISASTKILNYSLDSCISTNELGERIKFMRINRKDDTQAVSDTNSTASTISAVTIHRESLSNDLSEVISIEKNSKEENIVNNLYMFEKYADFMRQSVANDSFNILETVKVESESDMENIQSELTTESTNETFGDSSKIKIEVLEENYNTLKSKFSNLQQDHNKLTAITAELATALQYDYKNDKSILKKTLDNCMDIYPELFLQPLNERDSNDSKDFFDSKKDVKSDQFDTDSEKLRSQKINSSPDSPLQIVTEETYFELDFDKIKNDLLGKDVVAKIKLLQALRWRLTRAAENVQEDIIKSYVNNDILNLNFPLNNSDERNFKLLQHSFFPSSNDNEILLQQQIARFLNTLASLKLGRDYLTVDCTILKNILLPLMVNNKMELHTLGVTDITEGMLIAIFQKFSLRINQRLCLIEEGFLEFFIEYLTIKMHVLTAYALEYGTALLMNLCLHEEAQNICAETMKNETTHLIIALLNPKFMSCLPYVNGIIFSLLNNLQFYEHFKTYGLLNILQAHLNLTKGEDRSQLEFLINRLSQTQFNKFLISSDKINDTEDEIDLLEPELDLNEPEMVQFTFLSGERLLYENYHSADTTNFTSYPSIFNHPAIYHMTSRYFLTPMKKINMMQVLRERYTSKDFLTIFDVNNRKKTEQKETFENIIENLVKNFSPYVYWSICSPSSSIRRACNRTNCFPFKSKKRKSTGVRASEEMKFMLAPRPDDSFSTTERRPSFFDDSSGAGGSRFVRKSSLIEEIEGAPTITQKSDINYIIESKENIEKHLSEILKEDTLPDSSKKPELIISQTNSNQTKTKPTSDSSVDDISKTNQNPPAMMPIPVVLPQFTIATNKEADDDEISFLEELDEMEKNLEKKDLFTESMVTTISLDPIKEDSVVSTATDSKSEGQSLVQILQTIIHRNVSDNSDVGENHIHVPPGSILKKSLPHNLEEVNAQMVEDQISRSTTISINSCKLPEIQPPNSLESSIGPADQILESASNSIVSTHTGSLQWRNSIESAESKMRELRSQSASTGYSRNTTCSNVRDENGGKLSCDEDTKKRRRTSSKVSNNSSYPMKRNSNFTDLDEIDDKELLKANNYKEQEAKPSQISAQKANEQEEIIEVLDSIIDTTIGIVEGFFNRNSIPLENLQSIRPPTLRDLATTPSLDFRKRTSFKANVEDLESKEEISELQSSVDDSLEVPSKVLGNVMFQHRIMNSIDIINKIRLNKKKQQHDLNVNEHPIPSHLYDVDLKIAQKFSCQPKRRKCSQCDGVLSNSQNKKYSFQMKPGVSTLLIECTNPRCLAKNFGMYRN